MENGGVLQSFDVVPAAPPAPPPPQSSPSPKTTRPPPPPPLRVGVLLEPDPNVLRVARRNCLAMRHGLSGCRLAAVALRSRGEGDCDREGDERWNGRCEEAVRDFLREYVQEEGGGEEDVVRVFEGRGAYEELMESSDVVDAVYVPLPTSRHKEWALRSISAGHHVLVEHPAAPRASDYAEMLSAAHSRQKLLKEGTVFLHRHRTDEFLRVVTDESSVGYVDRVNCDLTCPDGGFRREHFDDEVSPPSQRGEEGAAGDEDGDLMGCIGTLGWYCVRMAVLIFSALGSGRAVDARVVHVRRRDQGQDSGSSGSSSPIDATCLVTFERDRTLSFHCGYRHGLCQRVEACGSVISASMTDFVWPRRKSSVVGVGGHFLLHSHDASEEADVVHRERTGGKKCEAQHHPHSRHANVVPAKDWHVTAMENGEHARHRGKVTHAASDRKNAPQELHHYPPQEAMMWRTFAMVAWHIDETAERGRMAARAAALAEAKGLKAPLRTASDDGDSVDLGGGDIDGGDEENNLFNGTAESGWVGRDGLLKEAERMADLSLRTQEIMDALLESVRSGCGVVKIA